MIQSVQSITILFYLFWSNSCVIGWQYARLFPSRCIKSMVQDPDYRVSPPLLGVTRSLILVLIGETQASVSATPPKSLMHTTFEHARTVAKDVTRKIRCGTRSWLAPSRARPGHTSSKPCWHTSSLPGGHEARKRIGSRCFIRLCRKRRTLQRICRSSPSPCRWRIHLVTEVSMAHSPSYSPEHRGHDLIDCLINPRVLRMQQDRALVCHSAPQPQRRLRPRREPRGRMLRRPPSHSPSSV